VKEIEYNKSDYFLDVDNLKSKIVDYTILVGGVAGLFAWLISDFNNISLKVIEITAIGTILFIYVLKKRVSTKIKVILLLVIINTLVISETLNFGSLAYSSIFLILGGYFANLIYPWKTTLFIYFLGVSIYLCLGAYLVFFLPVPYQNLSFSTYLTNAAVISIVALPILFFHTTYMRTVSNLISDLKSKNEILEIRENELSTYKNKLEKLVYDRTNELEEANQKLKNESKNLEESYRSLKDTQQQLVRAEKMASLGVLIAGIGHEINNPLNYIKGGIDGIKQYFKSNKLDLDKETIEYVKIMDEGVGRAAAILKGLSHAARQTDTMMESCNIHQILDNTLLILSNSLKEKISVRKDYSKDGIVVKGNDGKLHQLFINIITNAEQAIEKSGKIKISTKSLNNYALITVEDNGVGISTENINKIADPFYTTKDPGVGTGLGMYIANSIVEEHGGSWEINSEENKGTKVIIRLPV